MVRAVSPTVAPSPANRWAIALPSPRLAPVTKATLPAQAPVTSDPPPTTSSRDARKPSPWRESRSATRWEYRHHGRADLGWLAASAAGRQTVSTTELSLSYRPECLRGLLNHV